jgi:hypothetical protein
MLMWAATTTTSWTVQLDGHIDKGKIKLVTFKFSTPRYLW